MPLEPYYVTLSLEEGGEPEFLLIMPFTPRDRPNAIAWMAGRSDGDRYGELFAFRFPVGKNVNGPAQIEATIGNQPEIRERLTLLDQQGSGVIRGNLLFIPVGQSYLYVEPIYVQAEGSDFPQLQFVVVINGDQIGFAPTLEEAATQALGFTANTGSATVGAEPAQTAEPLDATAADDAQTVEEPDEEAQEEPGEQAEPPVPGDDGGAPATEVQALLDEFDRALEDSRGQVETLERLRDALQTLLAEEAE